MNREIIEQKTKEIGIKMVELANYSSFNTPDEQKNNIKNIAQESAKQMADWLLNNLWISVDEALPEIKEHFVSEDVLCRYSDGSIGFSRLKVNLFGQKWFEYEKEDSHVTHWMRIPEIKGGEK